VIEDGLVPFEELVSAVRAQERVWVRLGAVLKDGNWTAVAYDLVAPVEPPGWLELAWQYPEAVFYALTRRGPAVAEWLRAGRVPVAAREVILAGLPPESTNQQVRVHGLGSKEQFGRYEPLPWPTSVFALPNNDVVLPQKMLISADSPSFFQFPDAVASFFGLSWNQPSTVLPIPSVRLQDLSGRISKVTVHPANVDVLLEGRGLHGLTVELAGPVPGPQEQLSSTNETLEVRFPTPDGLPDEAWIVLKEGTTCVDRKFVNWRFMSRPDPDVEIVQQPASSVEALVAAGEGPQIEFKERVPEDKEGRKKVCRTLAAFANDHGGHLLFGVNDDGQIVGISVDGAGQSRKDTVTRWITDLVDPHLGFSLTIVEVDGRAVLYVEVEEGASPPYGVDPANPSYYIRRGATTFPASADDVRTIARARPPTPPCQHGLRHLP
jgi:hypothetical protein